MLYAAQTCLYHYILCYSHSHLKTLYSSTMKASQHERLETYRPRASQGLTFCLSMNDGICASVPNPQVSMAWPPPICPLRLSCILSSSCCSWRFDDPRCSSIDGVAAGGLAAERSEAWSAVPALRGDTQLLPSHCDG